MIFPEFLQRGDRIRIIAPSGKVSKDKVLPGIDLLQDAGYEVIVGRHVFDRHFQYAGTDPQRAADFQEAINDHQTKAIICARGGYGSARIIEKIDFSPLLANPKWLVASATSPFSTLFWVSLDWPASMEQCLAFTSKIKNHRKAFTV